MLSTRLLLCTQNPLYPKYSSPSLPSCQKLYLSKRERFSVWQRYSYLLILKAEDSTVEKGNISSITYSPTRPFTLAGGIALLPTNKHCLFLLEVPQFQHQLHHFFAVSKSSYQLLYWHSVLFQLALWFCVKYLGAS